ncbi:glycosyltransferase family 39 protein [Geobacter sp.]|uniref:ArnT family glycosyltransferase n=1 Tax=Geobacter sp. TaxID=46610 RepID=UPI00261307F1|nr:glycosyltransferase family 39 protein [Geobacter sp.]
MKSDAALSENQISWPLTVIVSLCWMLPGLFGHDPWKADEPYSFSMVRHILATHDWVVPTVAGVPFMEKPPLFYLTAAIFTKLFSFALAPHDAARIACAFYMGITFAFAALTARELYGTGRGRVSILLLLSCVGLQSHAHKLLTDIALLSGFAVALYGFVLSRRRPALGGLWAGTGIGIGFLSKGLLAPGILGIIALILPLVSREWRRRDYAVTLVLICAAALPWIMIWPFSLYRTAPRLFSEWLWVQNFGRFLGTSKQGPPNKPAFYFYTLPWFAWPALPLAGWAIWKEWRDRAGALRRSVPAVALVVMFVIFSVASDGRSLYTLPMLVPVVLLAVPAFDGNFHRASRIIDRSGALLFAITALVLWLGWIALISGHPAGVAAKLRAISPAYVPSFAVLPFVVALVYTVGWGVIALRAPASWNNSLLRWAAGMTMIWGLCMSLWLPWTDAMRSYRSMVASLQAHLPQTRPCIASIAIGESERAMLEYFAGIQTRMVDSIADVPCGYLLMGGRRGTLKDNIGSDWTLVWRGGRPGNRKEEFMLFRAVNRPQSPN